MTSRGMAWTLGALVALAYASVLIGGQTFADLTWLGDVAPARHAAGDAVAHGELPAWWHEAGFGVPLLAESTHGALYPPAWLAAAGPAALDAIAIAHLWLLAIGSALLAGRLGADAPGKLLAGAAAALAAASVGSLVDGALFSLAWSPLAAERAFALIAASDRDARIRVALHIAACLAGAGLGGAPPIADASIATVIAIGFAQGGAASGRFSIKSAARGAGWCAVAAAGSLALAAVQIAPALVHAASGDAVGPRPVLPGVALVELVAPGATGSHGAALGGGAAVLALAVLARSRWLAVPAVLVVAAAFGKAPPAVAWVWIAALAGAGLASVTRTAGERSTLLWAAGVLGTCAAALAIVAATRYPIAAAVDRASLDGARLIEHAIGRGALALGFAAAAIALALASARRGPATMAPAAALLALIECVIAARAAVPRRARDQQPGLVAALAGAAPARVFRTATADAPARVERDASAAVRDTLDEALGRAAAASAARLGIAAVPGTDTGRLALEDRMPAATSSAAARMLDRYAIDHAIVPSSIVAASGMRQLAGSGDEALVVVDARRPPAFWASRWRHVSDGDALTALAPPPGAAAEPLGTVLVAGVGDRGGDEQAAPRPCTMTRPSGSEVRLTCEVTAPGYAVVLDAWSPGWSASVDGKAAPVERADLIARAVRVAPGARVIHFRYTPPGFWLGAAISTLALLNVALLLWLTRPRTRAAGVITIR